jgi:hypothetical protein
MMKKSVFFPLLLLGLVISFSVSEAQTGSAVPTIANPKQPRPVPGRPCRPVFSDEIIIGGGDDPQSNPSSIIGVAVAKNGSLFLLDMRDLRVMSYAADGKFLRAFGRKGQGPGEFEWPLFISLSPVDEILVEDLMRRALYAYSGEGRLLRVISTASGSSPVMNIAGHPGGGFIALQISKESPDMPQLLRKFDAGLKPGAVLETRAKYDPRTKTLKSEVFWYALDAKGGIYVPDAAAHAIRVFSPEGLLNRRITRDYEPMKSPPDETKLPPGLSDSPPLKMETPKYLPAIRDCLLDESGRLFVDVQEKDIRKGTSVIDVFDPQGRYIARAELPGRPRVWKNGRVYLTAENESGYPILRTLRVDWK